MGMSKNLLQTFEVRFDGGGAERGYYTAGDRVSGRVRVRAARTLRVAAAGLRFVALGYARAELGKGSQALRQQQQEYLRHGGALCPDPQHQQQEQQEEPADANGCTLLRSGEMYEYTFTFQLPKGRLPPSFKGKYGGVCYLVKAFIEQEALPPLECSKDFEVVEPIDVNTPTLLSPVGGSNKKNLTCFFLADGYVCIAAKIDRKGYCQGDEICINAQFQNNCSRIIVPKAAILAKQTYLVNNSTRVVKEKLGCVRGNHIISGMSDSWCGKCLRIPTVKPSIECSILRLEYSLLIYVHIPGSKKLILDLPLVIGTIPYSGMDSRTSSMASDCSMNTNNSMSYNSMSWPHMAFPQSMSESSFEDNHRMECPTTPLLDENDGVPESPIFMKSPFDYPSPPVCNLVDENGNSAIPVQ